MLIDPALAAVDLKDKGRKRRDHRQRLASDGEGVRAANISQCAAPGLVASSSLTARTVAMVASAS
jgi:hypothetical protein